MNSSNVETLPDVWEDYWILLLLVRAYRKDGQSIQTLLFYRIMEYAWRNEELMTR